MVIENKMIFMRAESRIEETEYSVSSNNCESFVTWVLIGEANCEQFEQRSKRERITIDVIDGGLDHGKKVIKNGQFDLPTRVSATLLTHLISNSGDKLFIAAARTGATSASKVGPSAITAYVTRGFTAACAIPVETAFCGWEKCKLHTQKKQGSIRKKDFKRKVTRKVSGYDSSVTVAMGAGFLSTFIGHIVMPISVVGGLIGGGVGGIIGSIVGRASGSVISGKIFGAVTDK